MTKFCWNFVETRGRFFLILLIFFLNFWFGAGDGFCFPFSFFETGIRKRGGMVPKVRRKTFSSVHHKPQKRKMNQVGFARSWEQREPEGVEKQAPPIPIIQSSPLGTTSTNSTKEKEKKSPKPKVSIVFVPKLPTSKGESLEESRSLSTSRSGFRYFPPSSSSETNEETSSQSSTTPQNREQSSKILRSSFPSSSSSFPKLQSQTQSSPQQLHLQTTKTKTKTKTKISQQQQQQQKEHLLLLHSPSLAQASYAPSPYCFPRDTFHPLESQRCLISSLSLGSPLPPSSPLESFVGRDLREEEEREREEERGREEEKEEKEREIEREKEEEFVDQYLEIVNFLIHLPILKVEKFFLGLQNFEIDQFQLLQKMKEIISKEEKEKSKEKEKEREKKENIVKIVLCWRKCLNVYFRTFNPLLFCAIENFLDSLTPPLSPTLIWKGMSLCLCGSSEHVSKLLSFFMFQTFKKIQPQEFLSGFWQKEEKYLLSPNILAMREMSSRISSMVVESILFCQRNSRLKSLRFMIKLIDQLFNMNNFEGCAAILKGLNQFSIRRLKSLWRNLSSRSKKKYRFWRTMFLKDFKNYKRHLKSATVQFSDFVLPCLAPKLKELQLLYQKSETELEDGLINAALLLKIGDSIKSFLHPQQFEYGSEVHHFDNTLFLKFLQARSVPEELCNEKSLSLFPRN